MAATPSNVRQANQPAAAGARQPRSQPQPTRRNEIVAIALFAAALLFALCLASYHPNDPSWNSGVAETDARNLVGRVGANVAATLLQSIGFAAYLLPVLSLAAAWRCFRTRRIRAPLARVAGLALITLSSAALLALSPLDPLFDRSVRPGGLVGTVIAYLLTGGLNTVGAAVLLAAAAATGLLLATNFSFVGAYEQIAAFLADHSSFVRRWQERYRDWQQRRLDKVEARAQARHAARLERRQSADKTDDEESASAARVAEFVRSIEGATLKPQTVAAGSSVATTATAAAAAPPPAGAATNSDLAAAAIKRAAVSTYGNAQAPATVDDGAGDEVVGVDAAEPKAPKTRQHHAPPPPPQRHADVAARQMAISEREAADIAAMVETASVVRIEPVDSAPAGDAESRMAKSEAKQRRAAAAAQQIGDYTIPAVNYLNAPPPHNEQDDAELLGLATRLAEKCKEFNVTGQIKHICPGPVVTTFEFKPDPGVKYSRVVNLVDDLCLALKAESIRIDRLPGKSHVGIEVPNPHRETIFLREVIESRQFQDSPSKLTIALGKTIDGLNYVADLARMPHLLIAGSTGAGKSVCVNSLVVSVLYKARPDEVKFIMVDPKRLELGLYADIPHLATPIITDPKRAAHALKWAVSEMERRYKDLAGWGVRNIDGYNTEISRRNLAGEYGEAGEPWKPLPYIVIIIDELADLMMVSGHEVEESITRLAQMARAVGIHLVLATQRPSVDVITGLIKANFPSRISFRVSSKVDSRTIIDSNGAEQLLGRGDMLFLPPGTSRLVRVHGAYIDETEAGKIVSHIKAQSAPTYDESITQSEEEATGADGAGGERDELFEDALRICVEMKRASTSVLQRRLRIGYGRAAAILDAMERDGMIGPVDGARPRPVLGRAYETVAHWESLATES